MELRNILTLVYLIGLILVSILFVVLVVKYHLRIRASVTALGVRIACALQRARSNLDAVKNAPDRQGI